MNIFDKEIKKMIKISKFIPLVLILVLFSNIFSFAQSENNSLSTGKDNSDPFIESGKKELLLANKFRDFFEGISLGGDKNNIPEFCNIARNELTLKSEKQNVYECYKEGESISLYAPLVDLSSYRQKSINRIVNISSTKIISFKEANRILEEVQNEIGFPDTIKYINKPIVSLSPPSAFYRDYSTEDNYKFIELYNDFPYKTVIKQWGIGNHLIYDDSAYGEEYSVHSSKPLSYEITPISNTEVIFEKTTFDRDLISLIKPPLIESWKTGFVDGIDKTFMQLLYYLFAIWIGFVIAGSWIEEIKYGMNLWQKIKLYTPPILVIFMVSIFIAILSSGNYNHLFSDEYPSYDNLSRRRNLAEQISSGVQFFSLAILGMIYYIKKK